MRIQVVVTPNAKESYVKKEGDSYVVAVDAPPVKGKANKRLIEILADYFGVKKSSVKIIKGEKQRRKLIEIIK